ncbi:unnamed protein product [Polarella glacialis]|uniref:Uncharacterized protein n=1 Tax=Polarella glacialis TaxID=89957 RepID=A0A813H8Q1_POLGL|nr:unnamed protein product [Polarella glacialis]
MPRAFPDHWPQALLLFTTTPKAGLSDLVCCGRLAQGLGVLEATLLLSKVRGIYCWFQLPSEVCCAITSIFRRCQTSGKSETPNQGIGPDEQSDDSALADRPTIVKQPRGFGSQIARFLTNFC